ncbi:MAG: hypothetical protein ACRD4Y_15590, partial [Candidatus Acidiferrales bacterium]
MRQVVWHMLVSIILLSAFLFWQSSIPAASAEGAPTFRRAEKSLTQALAGGDAKAVAGSAKMAAVEAQDKPAIAASSSAKLSEQESRGEGLFLQR